LKYSRNLVLDTSRVAGKVGKKPEMNGERGCGETVIGPAS
jgi:hypothetical protein